MSKVITVCLVLVGLINVMPVLGVASAERLSAAYTVAIGSPDMELLLRHRALLFGVTGGFILYAAFTPAYQGVAMVMAAVSMSGFLFLAWSVGDITPALRRVALVDVVGIVLLLAAATLKWLPAGR